MTMDYEERQDRKPEDVSDENLGFDIQDPAANLQPEERVEVRYLVPVGDITAKGEKA